MSAEAICCVICLVTTHITSLVSRRNGELLKLMVAEHFEPLFTVDRNLPFQQNVRASGIAVVIAVARRGSNPHGAAIAV